ncbi:hypothetical protein JX265_007906 [Neoarthrinium moseri]|uniref:F-box domain-containing protein n=1 Tax=Neoarthrinium moseri TaxID=1658444 RepID=A0A9Q0AKF1_9PEZI|nr:hypothetical protein JX265_007906 [Neoarthrinium moseri]
MCRGRSEARENHLCRLPDEILLRIMQSLGVVDVEVLKRTCQQFMRLSLDSTLDEKYEEHEEYGGAWDPYRLDLYAAKQLRKALRRDMRCNGCRSLQEDQTRYESALRNAYRMLWCGGCRCWHPAFLYSLVEREKAPKMRACIGLQGHVRLCQHHEVFWDDLGLYASSIPRKISCEYEDHKSDQTAIRTNRSYSQLMPPNVLVKRGYRDIHIRFDVHVGSASFGSADGKDVSSQRDAIASAVASQVRRNAIFVCPHMADRESYFTKLLPDRLQPQSGPGQSLQRKSQDFIHISQGVERRDLSVAAACNVPGCCTAHFSVLTLDAANQSVQEISLISTTIIGGHSPCSPGWLDALDPKSYISKKDKLTRGIMWCPDPACATNFRGMSRHDLFYNGDVPLESNHRYPESVIQRIGSREMLAPGARKGKNNWAVAEQYLWTYDEFE